METEKRSPIKKEIIQSQNGLKVEAHINEVTREAERIFVRNKNDEIISFSEFKGLKDSHEFINGIKLGFADAGIAISDDEAKKMVVQFATEILDEFDEKQEIEN